MMGPPNVAGPGENFHLLTPLSTVLYFSIFKKAPNIRISGKV